MDWIQVLAIIGSTIGCCSFFWRLSKNDAERLEKVIEENRNETRYESKCLNAKFDLFKDEMKNEIKDFHGRLCALEEKYIQMMERYWESKK